jgi:hypothetical protein
MPSAPITLQKTRQFLIILWAAMFATLPVYFLIMKTVLTTENANQNSPQVFPFMALFGIVVYTLSGWPKSWVFLLMSAAGYLLNFPRRDDFDQLEATP